MRPLRLELEGFGAFRDRTVVDFAGAELFALTGPTGSGKTTIIDGVTFALYGSIPRYADRRLVAPAISQGLAEARVRLDFAVGAEHYTAVRVVRRTKAGATTKEARLERSGGEVLAGTADEVGRAVESLLGLSYDHFIKCVVLPQGEFARFLHDKPEHRQELLVRLLDLGVYDRMGMLARTRAKVADAALEVVDRRLAVLAGATPDAVAAADARAGELAALVTTVDAALPRIAAHEATIASATAEAAGASRWVVVLDATVVPAGVAEVGAAVTAAGADVATAAAAEQAAAAAVDAAERSVLDLPDRRRLEAAARAHEQAERHGEERAKAVLLLAERQGDEKEAGEAVVAADAVRTDAVAARRALEARHRAHAVVPDLRVGEPCPVCTQSVATLPAVTAPAGLAGVQRAETTAEADADRARKLHAAAERQVHEVEVKVASIDERLAELAPVLAADPERDTVAATLLAVDAGEAALAAARIADTAARRATLAATKALDEAKRREAAATAAYDTARDAVAAIDPPPRSGGGLGADWTALAAWATVEAGRLRTAAAEALAAATAARVAADAEREALAAACAAAGVVPARGVAVRDAVVEARVGAEADAARLRRDRAEAEAATVERGRLVAGREVAAALASHLRADRFEKWVLGEAVALLVAGATDVLHQLSGGQYSMAVDDRSGGFAVVDHRNAGEVRSARTLSGGETFLASLALALALADQIAVLAARGAVRLESIFLDEGFGTLDPDTLDTVASAIEELGASGRVVGLVSHVPELAERVPVRFEVTKVGTSASVRRVDS